MGLSIKTNIKLAKYTTFHIGGKAKYLAEINSIDELKKAIIFAKSKKLKLFVLGGGSNLLLSDRGFNGLVLKMHIKGITINKKCVTAGAGEKWDDLVKKTVKHNLRGIENLSLIPGTVGGAVYQNIAAYGSELKDVLESVKVLDLKSGLTKTLSRSDCKLGYRDSIFQHPKGGEYMIIGVTVRLTNRSDFNLTYPDLKKYFEHKTNLNIKKIRRAVLEIRRSKLVYPTKYIGTAGSFFKNPTISTSNYKRLAKKYPDIKARDIGKGQVKLFAGQLIEKAGWKGKRLNNVGVSAKHALVLVGYKGATAKDIIRLYKAIQKSVRSRFAVRLEPEVRIML